MDFNTSGTMRSPFSPRVRQSITGRRPIGLSAVKKTPSKFRPEEAQNGDVVYKTPLMTVSTYGLPLPVMVTEALTFATSEISVRLSPNGWCWLVTGRRLLAWPWQQVTNTAASPAPTSSPTARELMLPQTDLAHKADLVSVFYEDDAQLPSCIGVSPEGVVRYWPCVGQEGAFVDVSCELGGQECTLLTSTGLVLATTTPTVVMLTPTTKEGRPTVSCSVLRAPHGWLGGLGRRVSLLFFGSMPQHHETKLVGVVVLQEGELTEEGGGRVALVADGEGGPLLQLWGGAGLHTHALRRALTDAHVGKHLQPQGDLTTTEIVALDVRARGPAGLTLLLGPQHAPRSPDARLALVHISVEEPSAPAVTWVAGLRGGPGGELPPRALPIPPRALLYTAHYVCRVATTASNEKPELIDVRAEGDQLLGAELCDGVPLLFSRKHGVLALTLSDSLASQHRGVSVCESPMSSPCPSDMYDGNLSLYEIDPHEVSAVTTDACGKLKTAFLFHLRRDATSCRALLDQLFPPRPAPQGPTVDDVDVDVDAALDRTVLKIATEMLDDIPAGDPRWKQRPGGPHTNIALGSSAALQIAAQLRDKQRAFTLFVDFLRAAGLWPRLKLVTAPGGGGVIPTQRALLALAEQLAAAIALRRAQQAQYGQLIDVSIYQVVCGENPEVDEGPEVEAALSSGALSPSDVFYRRVSRAGRLLRALAKAPSANATNTITLLNTVLSEMHKTRAGWGNIGDTPAGPLLGPRALLPALADLHKRAITQYVKNCKEPSERAALFEASAALCDLILTECRPLRRNPHTLRAYETMRRDAILPYIEEGQIERAAALAEKFKDFELLIEMCVNSSDWERLYSYIDKYANQGIAETTFAWLTEKGGPTSAQLVRLLGARYPARLAAWLARAPSRQPLLALHHLAGGQYSAAGRCLVAMAQAETESVQRMTTTASLAKLCLLAGPGAEAGEGTWQQVERQLWTCGMHDALPRALRVRHGLDAPDCRVHSPQELVQMYIESESHTLTEYDYKKALDLVDCISDPELSEDLRLKIWCACVLRDDWSACRVDAPAEQLSDKTFFRLVDLVLVMGGDLELVLPPASELLAAPELSELASDDRFTFLLRYGYECLADTARSTQPVPAASTASADHIMQEG